MSLISEFKTFAIRGNVMDMAIGIIIGAAFGKIVNSLVSDIILPPIGLLIGGIDFSFLSIPLKAASADKPEVAIKYGLFLNTIIDFIIVAFSIFLVIKVMNRVRREEPVVADKKDCPECCMSIPVQAKKCAHCGTPLIPQVKLDVTSQIK